MVKEELSDIAPVPASTLRGRPTPTSPSMAVAPVAVEPVSKGTVRLALRRLIRDRAALLGMGIVAAFTLGAVLAPVLAPYSPIEPHYSSALRGLGHRFLLGTDGLGRDELSRLLFGARISLGAVSAAALAITFIGVTVGMVSGYYGGLLDSLIQRLIEILLAFPPLVLALAIAGVLGPSLGSVLIAVVAVHWVSYARVVRGMVLSTRNQPFVGAARASGATDRRIMVREILPNVIPPVIVLATMEMGGLLLTISSLSFLGLGAQPPTPEWGTMLNQARPYFQSHPYLMILPGLAITLAVLGFNLVGDALRDALDPRTSAMLWQPRKGLHLRVGRWSRSSRRAP
jgi:peptide/nickel transport system permease protein